jgi:hypothetical protein
VTDPAGATDSGLSAALATLQGLLTSGETLEAWAAQRRLYALTHRRAVIAADLTLVAQNNSDLNIGAQVNRVWTFEGLHKDQAQAMYRICQQDDQVWREKRRVRELEELRARSGGVQISGGQAGYGSTDAAGAESEPTRRLRQAREMLDSKLISDSEFESIKAKIVSGL